MAGMQKRLKRYHEVILRMGGTLGRLEQTGKHGKQYITYRGKEFWVLMSGSPSDHREFLNWKSQLRHKLKEIDNEKAAEKASKSAKANMGHRGAAKPHGRPG